MVFLPTSVLTIWLPPHLPVSEWRLCSGPTASLEGEDVLAVTRPRFTGDALVWCGKISSLIVTHANCFLTSRLTLKFALLVVQAFLCFVVKEKSRPSFSFISCGRKKKEIRIDQHRKAFSRISRSPLSSHKLMSKMCFLFSCDPDLICQCQEQKAVLKSFLFFSPW